MFYLLEQEELVNFFFKLKKHNWFFVCFCVLIFKACKIKWIITRGNDERRISLKKKKKVSSPKSGETI